MNRNTNLKSKMNGQNMGDLYEQGAARIKGCIVWKKGQPYESRKAEGCHGKVLFPYSWQDRWWFVCHMLRLTLRWTERVGPPVGIVTASCSVHTLNNNDVHLSE